MSFDSLQVHKIQLGIAVSSQNSLGEWDYTWTYSSTDTKCRLSPVSNKYIKDLPGSLQDVSYTLFLGPDIDINVGDRIQYSSTEYLVKSLILDSNAHHITCLIREL